MINRLGTAFLVAALVIIPFCGMQPVVAQQVASNGNGELLNEIVEQGHTTVDAALGTFTSADQKQRAIALFEAAKKELIRLMGKLDLSTINLSKINLNVRVRLAELVKKIAAVKIKLAPLLDKIDIITRIKLDQLMKKIDSDSELKKAMSEATVVVPFSGAGAEAVRDDIAKEILLLDQIVEQATNIIKGSFESRPAAQKELARLMNDENLDIPTKFAMSDDIETIQSAAGMNIVTKVSDAYKHLQSVVAERKAQLGIVSAPQGRMQQVIDYVSRKFQDVKQAVSSLWYGKGQ